MSTNTEETHEAFIDWASDNGASDFTRGGNVNECDTYTDPTTQIAWRLWQEVKEQNLVPATPLMESQRIYRWDRLRRRLEDVLIDLEGKDYRKEILVELQQIAKELPKEETP